MKLWCLFTAPLAGKLVSNVMLMSTFLLAVNNSQRSRVRTCPVPDIGLPLYKPHFICCFPFGECIFLYYLIYCTISSPLHWQMNKQAERGKGALDPVGSQGQDLAHAS